MKEHPNAGQITDELNSLNNRVTTLESGGGGGWVEVSEGPPVAWSMTPVPYFDVTLPDSYVRFLLEIQDICTDANDNSGFGLVFQLSHDGGTTWIYDAVNKDSYMGGTYGDSGAGLISDYGLKAAPKATTFHINIYPGNTVVVPSMVTLWSNPWAGSNQLVKVAIADALNPDATVTPTIVRYNKIRLFPYANLGNPPGSIRTITNGSWSLLGYE